MRRPAHFRDRIVADQDSAACPRNRIGKLAADELAVADVDLPAQAGLAADFRALDHQPHAARPARMNMLDDLLHLFRQGAEIIRRKLGYFQIVAAHRGNDQLGRRVGRIAVDLAVDVEPVVFQFPADAFELDSLLGEYHVSRNLPEMDRLGRAQSPQDLAQSRRNPSPHLGRIQQIVEQLHALVLLAGHPLLRMERHFDVAEIKLGAENRPAAAGVRIVDHLRHVDAPWS